MNISFVIPAFNCATTIKEAVTSVVKGNFKEGDELIIINDASIDETATALAKLQLEYPFITILHHNINKGTAAAGRNTGIDYSNNELIFCLDADNILYPNSIEKLKHHLLVSDADVAAFGELHYFTNNRENVTHKWVFRDEINLADCLAGRYDPCSSGNYLFRKESWLKAGRYYEPSLLNQTLDSWTFGIRLLATGAKWVTLSNNYYLHRYGIKSHYVREHKKGNVSLAALVALLPFLSMINEEDVDYIMSREGRYTWFGNREERPIRLKSGEIGKTGSMVNIQGNSSKNGRSWKILFQKLKAKVRSLISNILLL